MSDKMGELIRKANRGEANRHELRIIEEWEDRQRSKENRSTESASSLKPTPEDVLLPTTPEDVQAVLAEGVPSPLDPQDAPNAGEN